MVKMVKVPLEDRTEVVEDARPRMQDYVQSSAPRGLKYVSPTMELPKRTWRLNKPWGRVVALLSYDSAEPPSSFEALTIRLLGRDSEDWAHPIQVWAVLAEHVTGAHVTIIVSADPG